MYTQHTPLGMQRYPAKAQNRLDTPPHILSHHDMNSTDNQNLSNSSNTTISTMHPSYTEDTTGLSIMDPNNTHSNCSFTTLSAHNIHNSNNHANNINRKNLPHMVLNTSLDEDHNSNKNGCSALDSSSFVENASIFSTPMLSSAASTFSNNNINNKEHGKILADLYTTPELNVNHFDSVGSLFDTPITPISPESTYYPKHQFSLDSATTVSSSNSGYLRYPLNDAELEKFVLSPHIFHLSLSDKIGKGSNAFVYSCQLSTIGINHSSFNIAIKIPISKNKVKHIVQEARFAIKLRNYHDEWFQKSDRFYPFVDCYGLYYLNKEQFPLFKKNDELPCLLMKKMTTSLSEYITKCLEYPSRDADSLAIPTKIWWELCRTLVDALSILKFLKSVHCDLKTDNIMILQYNDDNDTQHSTENNILFKVIDFSSACEIDNLDKCPDMTLQYSAPELLDFSQKRLPTYQTDLFSAGLVLLEAATGSKPYANAGHDHFYLLTVIKEGKVLDWLSVEDSNILKANPQINDLLRLILVDRAPLERVLDFLDRV